MSSIEIDHGGWYCSFMRSFSTGQAVCDVQRAHPTSAVVVSMAFITEIRCANALRSDVQRKRGMSDSQMAA